MFSLANLTKQAGLIRNSKKAINLICKSSSLESYVLLEQARTTLAVDTVWSKNRFREELSVWINVVPPDGVPRRVAGFTGESLLDVITRNKIPGIFPDCNGGDNELKPYQIPYDFYSSGVSCGQCQVVVPDPYFDKLNKMIDVEQTRLSRTNNPQSSNSRLACCIQVRPYLNEMIVVIGNNKAQGSEFFTGFDPDAF